MIIFVCFFTIFDLMYLLGVKVQNMKMDFNTRGTWRNAMNTNDENL